MGKTTMMAKNLNQASQWKIHDDYHLHGTDSLQVCFFFVCLFFGPQNRNRNTAFSTSGSIKLSEHLLCCTHLKLKEKHYLIRINHLANQFSLSSRFSEQRLLISQYLTDIFTGPSEEAKYLRNYKPSSNILSLGMDLNIPKWVPVFGRELFKPF